MDSIFEVNDWAANTFYSKNEIVKQGNFHYYAKYDFTSSSSFDSSNWNGVNADPVNGKTKPEFVWVPSYNSPVEQEPNVKNIQFGEGYSQRLSIGISSDLPIYSVVFDKRDNFESRAIVHFLTTREAVEFFLFTPPFPYNSLRRFICKKWRLTPNFYNNFNINAEFMEVTA